MEDSRTRDFFVRGVTEEAVASISDVLECLRRGEATRHYAETKLNHQSSRSHTVFRVWVQAMEKGPSKRVTHSVLNFVDLAGSEKLSSHEGSAALDTSTRKSGSRDMRIAEGKNINKSLFFLTQVIQLRAAKHRRGASPPKKSGSTSNLHGTISQSFSSFLGNTTLQESGSFHHIPYRNSPLTKLLKNSLSGNSRTCIIVCITPCSKQVDQSVSSLRFGQNAMRVENTVRPNVVANSDEEAMRLLIQEYERRLRTVEQDKQICLERQQTEVRLLHQLLEERKHLHPRGTVESLDSARLRSLAKEDGLLFLDNVGLLEVPEALKERLAKGNEAPLSRSILLKAKEQQQLH